MNLNISQLRLLKHLVSIGGSIAIGDCEVFLIKSNISLTSARKYFKQLQDEQLINVETDEGDRRRKKVSINLSKALEIDDLL